MPPQISIVTPTYREAENIPILAGRIAEALRGHDYELIIADDFSDDGTDVACAELAKTQPLRLLSRRENRGLSPAVLDGIDIAHGEYIVVIDADLSHPPEKIIELIAPLVDNSADFTVGSRYVKGGATADNWPWWRRLNSRGAAVLAAPLTPIADSMSGFFALRRAAMPPRDILSPVGYKIGLEIAVKADFARRRIKEVPIFFGDREHGDSKMTLREQFNYLRHLRRLYYHRWPKPMEIFQFGAVGFVGFIWDVCFYYALQMLGMPHLWARALAFWPSVTSNWFLNRIMTFKTRPQRTASAQWAQFAASSMVGFAINWGIYATLTSQTAFFSNHLFGAFILGIVGGMVFNFIVADRLVFRRNK